MEMGWDSAHHRWPRLWLSLRILWKDLFQRFLGFSEKLWLSLVHFWSEYRLKERKKAFGILYLDLELNDAPERDLQQTLQEAKSDIAKLEQRIRELRTAIAGIKEKRTQNKLKRSPSITSVEMEPLHPPTTGLEPHQKTESIPFEDPEYVVISTASSLGEELSEEII